MYGGSGLAGAGEGNLEAPTSTLELGEVGPFLDKEGLKDLLGGRKNRNVASLEEYEVWLSSKAADFASMAMLDEPLDIYHYGVMNFIRDENGQTLEGHILLRQSASVI